MAKFVVTMQMRFMMNPAFIMSPVVIDDAPKTIAFGAVATGSMKAYEQLMTDVRTEITKIFI
jgi:hypothetical protein